MRCKVLPVEKKQNEQTNKKEKSLWLFVPVWLYRQDKEIYISKKSLMHKN